MVVCYSHLQKQIILPPKLLVALSSHPSSSRLCLSWKSLEKRYVGGEGREHKKYSCYVYVISVLPLYKWQYEILKFLCSKQITLIEHGFHLKTRCGA